MMAAIKKLQNILLKLFVYLSKTPPTCLFNVCNIEVWRQKLVRPLASLPAWTLIDLKWPQKDYYAGAHSLNSIQIFAKVSWFAKYNIYIYIYIYVSQTKTVFLSKYPRFRWFVHFSQLCVEVCPDLSCAPCRVQPRQWY